MKTILFLGLFLLCGLSIEAQTFNKEVIYIGYTANGGDFNSSTLIGTNANLLTKVEEKLKLEKPFVKKYVVNNKTLSMISRFVINNCDTINKIKPTSYDYITIKILDSNSVIVCFLENPNLSKPYFKRLIKELEKATYKASSKNLVIDLKSLLKALSRN